MVKMETIVVIFLLFFPTVWGLGIKDIVVIILSQENEHHRRIAENLKNDLREQARTLDQDPPVVHLSHRDFPHVGAWTILPLIPHLHSMHKDNSSWMFFVEDRTKIDLKNLLSTLNKHNPAEPIWLGHAVHDDEATIIHHFAFYDDPRRFKYPNPGSGILINTALLKRLSERLNKGQAGPQSDFGIDNAHELALFVWDKGSGQRLTHEPALCVAEGPGCASFPTPFRRCPNNEVDKNEIYFAVKTCQKYHEERVLKVVKRTWAAHATKVNFFSDVEDESIPTVALGIPNTEQGHCAKTVAILRYVRKELDKLSRIKWVVIADDDTILSVSRIRRLLTCYNESTPVVLGERYGFNVHYARGYNYITGGGGMVFSKALVKQLTEPGVCQCPSISAPDDMFLGLCVAGLGVSVTHSPLFHQARPVDYPPKYLYTKDAVSFHKHWMIDPVGVYKKWFAEEDSKESGIIDDDDDTHNEL